MSTLTEPLSESGFNLDLAVAIGITICFAGVAAYIAWQGILWAINLKRPRH